MPKSFEKAIMDIDGGSGNPFKKKKKREEGWLKICMRVLAHCLMLSKVSQLFSRILTPRHAI